MFPSNNITVSALFFQKKNFGMRRFFKKEKNVLFTRKYHHYNEPRNVGSLDKNDPQVGTGLQGAPSCGDVMKLQIKVNENSEIVDAKFKTFGCGSAIAVLVWPSGSKGKTIDEALELKNTDIVEELSLLRLKSTAPSWLKIVLKQRLLTIDLSKKIIDLIYD